jgi:RNA polymerase sigma factor for flagellar operon FliA
MAESLPGARLDVESFAPVNDSDRDLDRLVRILAAKVLARLPENSGIEMADLIQAGNIGLIQASRTFAPGCGVQLAGYAKFRIRGEMLDTIRRHSGRHRPVAVVQGSAPEEGADIEGTVPAPPEGSPFSVVAKNQRRAILNEELARLPARYRSVVRLRYARDFSLREIGATLQVHESRVCQLHRSALGRLKRALARRGVRTISMLM